MASAIKLATYLFGPQEEPNWIHGAGCGGDDDGTLFPEGSLFSIDCWSARMP